ncbi:MAG: chorismate mutase [Dehalococcoidia bacterium]|nr:chorismate mutase [Dehalococcoidia bacterium]
MALLCRGLRGATTARDNTREAILEATRELLERLVEANNLKTEDVAAAFFTTSQDLNAEFPAVAARQMGWDYVPLICGHEMKVPDGLPLCIRVMMLVNTERRPEEMVHKYLRDAKDLRNKGIS